MTDHPIGKAAAETAPVVAALGWHFFTLSNVAAIVTIVLGLLQSARLIWQWRKEIKSGKAQDDGPD